VRWGGGPWPFVRARGRAGDRPAGMLGDGTCRRRRMLLIRARATRGLTSVAVEGEGFIKFYLKIANKFEISIKLNMSLDMLCIAYKKVVALKFKMKIHKETKPSGIGSNFLKLLVRCSRF
jgi:hypothetical protein